MRTVALSSPEDMNWLRRVTLSEVQLPASYIPFQFAVVHGNEDAPDYVDLFINKAPLATDDFLRIRFTDIAPLSYCEYVVYNGKTQLPKTGGHTKLAQY